jgi:excisionase family DNA binding protein
MDWLTLREAAEYLKIRPGTLGLWVRTGKAPGHKLSGTRRCVWRFLRCELDAMLALPSGAQKGPNETSTAI